MPKINRKKKRSKYIEPEPPNFKSGEWEPEYRKENPLYTVTLDHGAFIFAWEWANRRKKWMMQPHHEYLGETLRSVSSRTNDAFVKAYIEVTGFEPEQQPKRQKKRKRCPATNKRGEQCRRAAGHPLPHRIKS